MNLIPEIQFTTKTGKLATIRLPQLSDAPELTRFINEISLEDTFIRFSGEQQTVAEEEKYLQSEIEAIEKGEAVKLFVFIDGKLCGGCDVHRDNSLLARKKHIGVLGLIVDKNCRGEGVGKELITQTIKAAQEHISGLKMIVLECFATNTIAMNLYKKVGFVEVGRMPKGILHKGEYVDEVKMILEL